MQCTLASWFETPAFAALRRAHHEAGRVNKAAMLPPGFTSLHPGYARSIWVSLDSISIASCQSIGRVAN